MTPRYGRSPDLRRREREGERDSCGLGRRSMIALAPGARGGGGAVADVES
jgi:hypothetical protein